MWIENGGDAMSDEVKGAILISSGVIMAITASYVVLNKLYFERRKHLFTR